MLMKETRLTLQEAADLVGKSYSTVYRWATQGVDGVRLEALRLGYSYVTSVEALERFGQRLNTPADDEHDSHAKAGHLPADGLCVFPDDPDAVLASFGLA
jgi:hypothetical protein